MTKIALLPSRDQKVSDSSTSVANTDVFVVYPKIFGSAEFALPVSGCPLLVPPKASGIVHEWIGISWLIAPHRSLVHHSLLQVRASRIQASRVLHQVLVQVQRNAAQLVEVQSQARSADLGVRFSFWFIFQWGQRFIIVVKSRQQLSDNDCYKAAVVGYGY